MFSAFGLGSVKHYLDKPVPQLHKYVLQGHGGKEVHTIEAEDYSLSAAIAAMRKAGYKLVCHVVSPV